MYVSVVGQCYHSTYTSDSNQASLITGLEYGLEQWNGLWNGLRSFVCSRQHHFPMQSSCFHPFLVCQTSEELPYLQLRLLTTYRTYLSNLIKLTPKTLRRMHECGPIQGRAMSRIVSKYSHRSWSKSWRGGSQDQQMCEVIKGPVTTSVQDSTDTTSSRRSMNFIEG